MYQSAKFFLVLIICMVMNVVFGEEIKLKTTLFDHDYFIVAEPLADTDKYNISYFGFTETIPVLNEQLFVNTLQILHEKASELENEVREQQKMYWGHFSQDNKIFKEVSKKLFEQLQLLDGRQKTDQRFNQLTEKTEILGKIRLRTNKLKTPVYLFKGYKVLKIDKLKQELLKLENNNVTSFDTVELDSLRKKYIELGLDESRLSVKASKLVYKFLQDEDISKLKEIQTSNSHHHFKPLFWLPEHYYKLSPVDIQEVQISIKDGLINDLLVRAKTASGEDIIFDNRQKMSLNIRRDFENLNIKGKNFVRHRSHQFHYYIDIANILNFEREVIKGSGSFLPKDEKFVLNRLNNEAQIQKKRFVKNIDIRIYTDLEGFEKEKPNGLVQFEGRYFQSAWTQGGKFQFLNYVIPFLKFSKIEENQNKLIPVNKNLNTDPYIETSRLKLLEYAQNSYGLILNISSLRLHMLRFELNLSSGLFQTQLDSVIHSKYIDTLNSPQKNIYSYKEETIHSWFIKPSVKFIFIENQDFTIDLGYGYFMTDNLDNKLKLTQVGKQFIGRTRGLHHFEININYFPGNDPNNSIFLKMSSYIDEKDIFKSVQLGYAFPLRDLFSKFEDSKVE